MQMTAMRRRSALIAAALALALDQGVPLYQGVALWPAPAMAEEAAASGAECAPEVERALIEGARIGVERDVAVLRHPDQGIRDPDSILDFSCLDDLFDFRRFDILFDPGRSMADLLGLVQRRICAAAREAYRGYVGRHLDASLYTARSLRLPGLGPAGDSQRATRAGTAGRDRGAPSYRRVPPEQGVPLDQRVPLDQGVPLFRSIVGGSR